MPNRIPLPQGYLLRGGARAYEIERYLSAGSNAVVYQVLYRDTLMPEHTHTVLIKELYPLDPAGRITRDDALRLVVPAESEELFDYHRRSFLLGNQAHLSLSEDGGAHVAENLDSFEANGTLYTVLSSRRGRVLSTYLTDGPAFSNLTDAALTLQSLLRALQPFHAHRLLHLDVSPDNIFVLAADVPETSATDVLLLDFNSVYALDGQLGPEGDYYLGKPAYTAPEVALHQKDALGPWTDLYSVAAVFYQMLTGEVLPEDRELLDTSALISPYGGLLLHEKECSAVLVNGILEKGLQILPEKRYQDVPELLSDVNKLLGVLTGSITDYAPLLPPPPKKKLSPAKKLAVTAAVLAVIAGGSVLYLRSPLSPLLPTENTVLDLTKIPLERDDSIVLSQVNTPHPLQDNILSMDVRATTTVLATLKDFSHPRDVAFAFLSYSAFPFYTGEGDRRGMQFGEIYDPGYSDDNSVHMELPLIDPNSFDLKFAGVTFSDWNYKEVGILFDITKYTLTDGQGTSHEVTDMVGGHIVYFDENVDTWYLMTDQVTEFVTNFEDMYGGKIEAHAELNALDDLLEVTWESDNPKVATVDQKGNITGVSQGQAKITVTVKDKNTGDIKKTQMLVNVKISYGGNS